MKIAAVLLRWYKSFNVNEAYLFLGNDKLALNAGPLAKLRECLPTVDFIRSKLAISDQVLIAALISAYATGTKSTPKPVSGDGKGTSAQPAFDYAAAQRIAQFIAGLNLNKENP